MTPEELRQDPNTLYKEMTVDTLQNLTHVEGESLNDKLNWTRYLNYVMAGTNVTVHNSDPIMVLDINYFKKLARLISTTPQKTLEKFIWWKAFSTMAYLTVPDFQDVAFRFNQNVFGLKEETPRWKGCVRYVNNNFGMVLSYKYVKKYSNSASKAEILQMVNDVRSAFVQMTSKFSWMDEQSKQRTVEKVHAMRSFISFPDRLLIPGELDKYYKKAAVVDGLLFETHLRLSEVSEKTSLENLGKAPDNDQWVATATSVNAFYTPIRNSMTFPAAIQQPPFYRHGLESMNSGSFGFIIGHEMAHGFGNQGRRYDKDGNLNELWTQATLQQYKEREQCIVDQYSNFTVNGINTQGENIADNLGLNVAYHMLMQRNSPELALPGLPEYTHEQLFFIAYAHMWCGSSTDGAQKSQLFGSHSPNSVRVNGPVMNFEGFSKAFNCPVGSPMNPSKKCELC